MQQFRNESCVKSSWILREPDPGEGDGGNDAGPRIHRRAGVGRRSGHDSEEDLGSKGEVALIKKKIKFSSYIRKCRVEQLQSHT